MRDGWERESNGLMRTQDYGWDSGKRFQHRFFLASHTHPNFHHPRAGLSAGSFLNSPRLLFISLEMAVNRG